jgi:hypothetical protein
MNALPNAVLKCCNYDVACYHTLVIEFKNTVQFKSAFIFALTQQHNNQL